MIVEMTSLDNLSVTKAFKKVRADIVSFGINAYMTTNKKYKTIYSFRALCHKVRENAKYEKQIKKIVIDSGINWDDNNIELSINKSLCSKIPDEIKKTSSFKRYLYDSPRIVRVIDEKNIALEDTYGYLQKYGIDKLANNRIAKGSSSDSIKEKTSSEVRLSLEEVKQNCANLANQIRHFLND